VFLAVEQVDARRDMRAVVVGPQLPDQPAKAGDLLGGPVERPRLFGIVVAALAPYRTSRSFMSVPF